MSRFDNRCVCDKCGRHYSCDSGVPHECPTADVEMTEATMSDKLAEATLVNARQDKDLELHGKSIADLACRVQSLEGSRRSPGGPTVPNEYRITKDGDSWCASGPGFENLMESPSAFGDTPLEAMAMLFRQSNVVIDLSVEKRTQAADARIRELEALKTPRLQCLRDAIGSIEEKHDAEGAAKIALHVLNRWREEAMARGEAIGRLERVIEADRIAAKLTREALLHITPLEWRKAHPCPHEAEVRANGCARGPEASCYCHNSPARYTPEELHGEKDGAPSEGLEDREKKDLLEASIRDVCNVLDWMPMEDVRRNVLYDALGVLRQLQ